MFDIDINEEREKLYYTVLKYVIENQLIAKSVLFLKKAYMFDEDPFMQLMLTHESNIGNAERLQFDLEQIAGYGIGKNIESQTVKKTIALPYKKIQTANEN